MSLPSEPPGNVFDLDCEAIVPLMTDFIKQQLSAAGKKAVVIGMSGGVDSSLVAHLAVRAIGADRVHGYLLPYETSSQGSLADARMEIEKLRMPCDTIEITPMIKALRQQLPGMDQRRLGNAMARTRMIVLHDRSEEHDALVIGTSNRTEMLLGYGTIFGDTAWAFDPIGDLYKNQVRALSRHLGVAPSIVEKAPSADLWAGQTDEEDLGVSYDVADRVLYLMFERSLSASQIADLGYDAQAVSRIARMVARNAFKRQRAPILTIRQQVTEKRF